MEPIDVNAGSDDDLTTRILGVGIGLSRIVAMRPFSDLDDLTRRVNEGITEKQKRLGKSKLRRLRVGLAMQIDPPGTLPRSRTRAPPAPSHDADVEPAAPRVHARVARR